MKTRYEPAVLARGLLALFALAPTAAVAQSHAPAAGYPILRYQEDYSRLCDAPGAGFPLALKCVPLGPSDSYLSFGAEARAQWELYESLGWGAARQDPNGYLLQRYMLHGDLHLPGRARVFLQIKSGIEGGRPGGPRPPDEDLLDIHQGFLELRAAEPLTLNLGRQELAFGSGRLISVRDGPNVRQSFDGIRAVGRLGAATMSTFLARPAKTERGVLDDGWDSRRLLWGAYLTAPLPNEDEIGIDIYYLGHENSHAHFQAGEGAETRHSLGTRLAGQSAGFRYDVEGVFQFGSFRGMPIRAWLLALETSYGRRYWPLSTRAALSVSVGSGDDNPGDRTLGTFHPLYARSAELAKPPLMSPGNLLVIRPGVYFSPAGFEVRAEYALIWRRSLSDGVYDVTGDLLLPARGSSARPVGREASLTLARDLGSHTTVMVSYSRFLAGRFLKEVTPGKDLGYTTALVRYWF